MTILSFSFLWFSFRNSWTHKGLYTDYPLSGSSSFHSPMWLNPSSLSSHWLKSYFSMTSTQSTAFYFYYLFFNWSIADTQYWFQFFLQLRILWNAHHNKCSYLLSPYKDIIIVLTIFSLLYFSWMPCFKL